MQQGNVSSCFIEVVNFEINSINKKGIQNFFLFSLYQLNWVRNCSKVWGAIKKEIEKEKHELTPYSFKHRYAYYEHNWPRADGSYRAPKQVADAMGHTLDTHLLRYFRFQIQDFASAFDETSLQVKDAA